MIYWRCKCGAHEAWSSGESFPCARCSKCGSGLATSPNTHQDPLPHDFVPHSVETDDGAKTLSRCRYCHQTRAQITRAEAKAAEPSGDQDTD